MARQVTILRVLVASPGDVSEERAALEHIVRELNLTWAGSLGIQVELVRWETHATPGVGVDPQDVINRQLADDYDIFVGLMWTRFGTPTLRSESGTHEEFERAVAQHAEGQAVDIMFYFKDAPIAPSQIDLAQLDAVQRFRAQLGDRGALYWTFHDLEDFQSLLRIHLGRRVQAWRERLAQGHPARGAVAPPQADPVNEAITQAEVGDLSDLGILDLVEVADDAFMELGSIAERMATDILSLGQSLEERTNEARAIGAASDRAKVQLAKRVVRRASEDMDQYFHRTRTELPAFSLAFQRGVQAFGRAIAITTEFGPDARDQISNSLEQVNALRLSIRGATDGAEGLRSSIARLPRMSGDLIRAKKRTVGVLDEILNQFQSAESLLGEIEDSMRTWLREANG